jgi:hypothetical protein
MCTSTYICNIHEAASCRSTNMNMPGVAEPSGPDNGDWEQSNTDAIARTERMRMLSADARGNTTSQSKLRRCIMHIPCYVGLPRCAQRLGGCCVSCELGFLLAHVGSVLLSRLPRLVNVGAGFDAAGHTLLGMLCVAGRADTVHPRAPTTQDAGIHISHDLVLVAAVCTHCMALAAAVLTKNFVHQKQHRDAMLASI